ncbi:hypothetical protein ACP70R_037612 [Stipagrostis hirtigluma subsp. patula]
MESVNRLGGGAPLFRSPSLPSHHVGFSSPSSPLSSSSCCRWTVAGASAPVLPLGICRSLRPLPAPLLQGTIGRGAAAARTRAAATAALPPAEGGEKTEGAGTSRTLLLGSMILVWYLLNIYNKLYAKLLPLAVIHMLGNVFTNMSLGKVAVSFTHTIKAMEPFFSVLLSA